MLTMRALGSAEGSVLGSRPGLHPTAFRAICITATLVLTLGGSQALAGVGRTVGAFAVAPSGAATYSIPIWAPPGPQGMQPHVSLIYDSRLGDGPQGVGWVIAGLSSISRCNLTVAQDGTAAGITLTYADRFCLDGKRLRLTSSENLSTYGEDGTTYQTEVADFSNITAHGVTGNGPDYFTVQGRTGWTYEYGHTTDSQVSGGGSTAFAWMLDKVTDRAGNTMTITWMAADAKLTGMTVPEKIEWTPSSYGSSTYNYTMQFNYQVQSLAVKAGYLAGQPVQNFYGLTSIQIESGGTTVKDYFLSYTASGTTDRPTLTSITECADTAKSNCLYPTQFHYQAGQAGLGGATTLTSSSSALGIPAAAYDFNGDGRNDLAWYQNGTWQVAFATSSGYSAPINTGITDPYALKDSVDGSGTDGFLAQVSGSWWWYKWNGSSFVGTNIGVGLDTTTVGTFALADVNGDGLPDLITTRSDGYLYVRLNTSSGGTVSFSSSVTRTITRPGLISSTFGTRRADFSGTGQQDLFALRLVGVPPNLIAETLVLHFTGTSFVQSQYFLGYPTDVADYNDDGCSDVLFPNELVISACNGAPAQTITLNHAAVAGLDWDGDGRRDILVANGSTLGAYLSIGTGISSTLVSTGIPYSSSNTYTVAHNATGDGMDALVMTTGTSPYALEYYLHNGAGAPPDLLTSATDGYGNSIAPAYTSIVQGAYSNYKYANPTYPYELYLAPMYVVSNITFSDPTSPTNGTYSQSYSYVGSWKNMQGRGFSNFINVLSHDSRNNIWRLDCYENKFPFSGTYACTHVSFDQAGKQVIRDRFGNHALTTLDGTADNERYFIYQNQWTDKKYQVSWSESAGSTAGPLIETDSTTYQYDNFGNATNVATTLTDNDSNSPYLGDSWTTTVTNTPDVNTSTWCIALLSETQTAYSSSIDTTSVTRTKSFTPDTTYCRYTGVTTEPGSPTYEVSESFNFDNFGNVIGDTIRGIGMGTRGAEADWGTTGQFPMSETDASGQTTQLDYDFDLGLPKSRTDANTLKTSWVYDAFGRLTQESRPDGTSSTYSIADCAPYNICNPQTRTLLFYKVLDNTQTEVRGGDIQLDDIDRPFRVWSKTLNADSNTLYSMAETDYDSLGRVAKQSFPCLTASCASQVFTTMSYDVLNRLVESQRPTSDSDSTPAHTDYAYAGRTTTITDANGHATTLVHDLNGRLRRTEDATGYSVTLGYDAAGGHIESTDSLGNPLWSGSVAYGIAPFTVASTDADLGAWTFTVDALGELTAWTDAKGQKFSAHYDALSRMTDRYEPDFYTHWTWGTSAGSHNIGQLASVCTGTGLNPMSCNGGYAENESYDGVGRLSQHSIIIPGDTTYHYTYQYNAAGLLDTLTYPATSSGYALAVKYGYAYGLLQSLKDVSDTPNVTLWTGNAGNARFQYTQETLGNGVVVNHDFDTVTGAPSAITAGVGSGAALQNNSYLFDAVGNLTQRQDNNAGVTENVYPDALNRLDHTVGDTSTTMTYDAMGRIATWEAYGNSTNVNDYTTRQAGCTYYSNAQPHAVRGAKQGSWPPDSFCYDANGNLTTWLSNGSTVQSVTWMSFNQPNKITAPTYDSSSQFLYDQNHQRYKQLASYSGSAETTEYIGGLMELMTNSSGTAYRYYVPAGNNFIVYNRWTNGTNALDYVTQDHLGSSAVITDKNGALVVKEKYAALGWNENTTAELATMAGITRHEYTGQEGLNNAGLGMVNMNGRIYIPSGSRFLSPDPIIQDPSDTQAYNRYSYARNNALTFVDPSGFDCGVPFDPFTEGIGICAPPELPPPDIPDLPDCIECYFPGPPPGPYPVPGPGFPTAPQLQPVVVKGARWSPLVQASLPPQDLQPVSFNPNNIPGIALPPSLFQQQQCTAAQQAAAGLAAQLESVSRVSGVLAATSGLGTLLAGAGEGVTFGLDTPVTITYASLTTYFTAASFITGAGAAAANSFANGNLGALANFDFSQLEELTLSTAASRIPGIGEFAEKITDLAEAAADLASKAEEACQ